jgi:hypothetical protein
MTTKDTIKRCKDFICFIILVLYIGVLLSGSNVPLDEPSLARFSCAELMAQKTIALLGN